MGFKLRTVSSKSFIINAWLIIASLLITLLYLTKANANDAEVEVNEPGLADFEFARSLAEKVRPSQLDESIGKNIANDEASFYIFASLTLSNNDLKKMMLEAARYNGAVIIRGLVDNSFPKTITRISELKSEGKYENASDDDSIGLLIDPILFSKYEVNEVPTYVLAKEKECYANTSCIDVFDKLTGNVTPKFALEQFARKGDLQQQAANLLSFNGA